MKPQLTPEQFAHIQNVAQYRCHFLMESGLHVSPFSHLPDYNPFRKQRHVPELIFVLERFPQDQFEQACACGHFDVNDVDDLGNSALHIAALGHRLDEMRSLLAHGADIEIRNKHGLSPLFCAAGAGVLHEEDMALATASVALLLAHGANAGATDRDGHHPEAYAEYLPVQQMLIAARERQAMDASIPQAAIPEASAAAVRRSRL